MHTEYKQAVNLTDIHMNQHKTTALFEKMGFCDCTKKNVIYVESKGQHKNHHQIPQRKCARRLEHALTTTQCNYSGMMMAGPH